jgi:hypothetical protein
MNGKYHRPGTQDTCRTNCMDQPAAPAPDIHDTALDRGDELEAPPRLSHVRLRERPPGTAPPAAPKEFVHLFGNSGSFREEFEDALRRLGDAPESADDRMSAGPELPSEFAGAHLRPSAAHTDVGRMLNDPPYNPDDLRLKILLRQQSAARECAQLGQGKPSMLPAAWPGLMCEAIAAYYLGQIAVSTTIFARPAARHRGPPLVSLAQRTDHARQRDLLS